MSRRAPADLLPGEASRSSHPSRQSGGRAGSASTDDEPEACRQAGETGRGTRQAARVRAARRLLPPTPPTLHGIPWGPGEVLVATTSGTRLLCPTEDLSLSPELALTGTYDPPFVDFLKRRLRPGMTFVDVGANVGLFTILAASRVGPAGRVFAYECNPELIGFLRRNIAMSWFDDRVRLIPKAAHRDDEERRFPVPRDQKMLGSLTRFDELGRPAEDLQEFQVSCERLDVGLADVPYIDLLKIDVEGGEAAVLDGASRLLDEGRVGVIAMEYRESRTPRRAPGRDGEAAHVACAGPGRHLPRSG